MSKIHEALRKAQQERNANVTNGNRSSQSEVVGPVDIPSLAVSPVVPGGFATPAHSTTPGDFFRIDYLREHCVKPVWKINPEVMVFAEDSDLVAAAEQFRNLRSHLYQLRENRQLRSLLITSALASEGKTFVASNLAQAIARQPGQRVLLIDADLRLSKLHIPLGAPCTPGLSDFLRGNANLTDVMQHATKENLYFIPGGNSIADPTELILNGRFKDLVERLTPTFDWIIMDSPPTLAVSDAGLLADLCDGVLLVVRAASTNLDAIQKACNKYRERNLAGVVLNRVEHQYTYDSYYGYGTERGAKVESV
ncbi:MAG TPA: CpsD/CapB family tyrosine-protein kinase [Candidatus Dormibacteraeota bacterium]|nr:CpsD/CapB family tyrosine-protein kinase [Candidatus Dormibacteraeota bacterium]